MTQLSLDELAPTVRSQWITGRNNKRRLIHVPNDAMRQLHKQLIREIRQQLDEIPAAFGAVRGGSPVRHAVQHSGRRYVYKLDIYNAFPSVKVDWLTDFLREIKSELWVDSGNIEEFARRHLVLPSGSGLMTGTPASPDLFNRIAAKRLDETLLEFAMGTGTAFFNVPTLRYTRYLDDLVFSSHSNITKAARRHIREIVRSSGFRINFDKTGYFDLQKKPTTITGFRIGNGPLDHEAIGAFAVHVPRRWLNRLEGVLYCFNRGDNIAPEYIEGLMGVLREVRRHEPNFLSRHEARVWGAYLAVRPRIRPNAPLSRDEKLWALRYEGYLNFIHENTSHGVLRPQPLPPFPGYVSPFPGAG